MASAKTLSVPDLSRNAALLSLCLETIAAHHSARKFEHEYGNKPHTERKEGHKSPGSRQEHNTKTHTKTPYPTSNNTEISIEYGLTAFPQTSQVVRRKPSKTRQHAAHHDHVQKARIPWTSDPSRATQWAMCESIDSNHVCTHNKPWTSMIQHHGFAHCSYRARHRSQPKHLARRAAHTDVLPTVGSRPE